MTGPQRIREGDRRGWHPDFGRLIRDEVADTVICHVCGRAFRSLGAHVRVHDMTAAEYQEEFGLLRTRVWTARSLLTRPVSPGAVSPGPGGMKITVVRQARAVGAISSTRARMRDSISSRMGRTASTPRPAGSSRVQSRYFLPGKTGQVSPQPIVITTSDA